MASFPAISVAVLGWTTIRGALSVISVLPLAGLAYQNVIDLLARSADRTAFVNNLDTGMHAAEHTSIGRMLFDLFVSPGDSVFYYHHAQVE